jgi:hypothetical protein
VSRTDPKPGRWILPLVVLGIVAFTWVFVNALPPAPDATTGAATATTAEPPGNVGTTTTVEIVNTTTTSTIPPEIAAFVVSADTVADAADALLLEAAGANDTWESGRNFTLALNSLRDIASRTSDFTESVVATSVPESLTSVWDPVRVGAEEMLIAADEMVTGLQAPDTGQIRRAALADFSSAVATLTLATSDAKAAAQG